MGIGIGRFLPWELNGAQVNGTGIWSLGMGKSSNNQKWEWDLSTAKWNFEKKWGWESGISTPPPLSPHLLQDPHE